VVGVVSLTRPLGDDSNTGKGEVPSPTMATGLQEAMGVAPVMAQSAPASVNTASKAVSSFFMCATSVKQILCQKHPAEFGVIAR
jgi:hypothetical protein